MPDRAVVDRNLASIGRGVRANPNAPVATSTDGTATAALITAIVAMMIALGVVAFLATRPQPRCSGPDNHKLPVIDGRASRDARPFPGSGAAPPAPRLESSGSCAPLGWVQTERRRILVLDLPALRRHTRLTPRRPGGAEVHVAGVADGVFGSVGAP